MKVGESTFFPPKVCVWVLAISVGLVRNLKRVAESVIRVIVHDVVSAMKQPPVTPDHNDKPNGISFEMDN